MRELMSHSGGFTYGFFSNSPVDKLQREADVLNINNSLDEFIKRMAKLPLNAQPGSEWHYSVSVDIRATSCRSSPGCRSMSSLISGSSSRSAW